MDTNKLKTTALHGITQNPTFVLVLGMCPTIATSKTLVDSFGMGMATLVVLVLSNVIISLLRRLIPDKVRIPCYILIIASLVTLIDLFMKKYIPSLYSSLGVFIPLIVVNCIIFARAEAYASSNSVGYAAVDGLSMGLGFTLSLCALGITRELLSYGNIVLQSVSGDVVEPLRGTLMPIFQEPAGGFLILAILMAVFNVVYKAVKDRAEGKRKLALNQLTQGAGAAETAEA